MSETQKCMRITSTCRIFPQIPRTFSQGISRMHPKHGQRANASSVVLKGAIVEDVAQLVEVLQLIVSRNSRKWFEIWINTKGQDKFLTVVVKEEMATVPRSGISAVHGAWTVTGGSASAPRPSMDHRLFPWKMQCEKNSIGQKKGKQIPLSFSQTKMPQLIAFFRGFLLLSVRLNQSSAQSSNQSTGIKEIFQSHTKLFASYSHLRQEIFNELESSSALFSFIWRIFFLKNVTFDRLTGFSFVSEKESCATVLVTLPAFRNVISASLFRAPKRGKKAEDQRRLNGRQPAQWQAGLEDCFYRGTTENRLLRAGRGVFWEREHKPPHDLVGAQLWCPAGGGWFDQPGMLLFSLINQSIDRLTDCLSFDVLNPSVFLMVTDEIYPFLTY